MSSGAASVVNGDAEDGQPAKKRRQNLSCDSCRLRRVRCEREDINQTCRSCAQRDIRCTNEQLTRPRANRGGARIAEARSRFGSNTTEAAQSSPTTPNFSSSRLEPDPAALAKLSEICVPETHDSRSPPVASTSRSRSPPRGGLPEGRLYPMGLSSMGSDPFEDPQVGKELSKHLINCYRETYHYKHPCFEWDDFWTPAYACGFEAMAMPTPELEVLCLTVQAFGARISDHPLIVGPDGPSRKSLPSGDLTIYGQRREQMCMSLLTRASNRFNIRGIALRDPSSMGFACILTLRFLLIVTDDMSLNQARLLSALCVENLRIFMEQGFDPPAFVRQVFWSKFVISHRQMGLGLTWSFDSMGSESIMSALTGRQLQFQESDIELYAPGLLQVSQDAEQDLFAADPQVAFRGAMKTLFAGLAVVARQICIHLTGPAARLRGKTDPGIFVHLWEQLEHQRTLSANFAARVQKSFGSKASIMEHYLRMLASGRICLTQVLDESFKRRLGAETDPAIVAQMTPLSQHNDRQYESAVMQLAEIFEAPGAFVLDPYLHKLLEAPMQRLLWKPCKEEGAPSATWTLSEKIKTVSNVLNIFHASSWAWPVWTREITTLESQLAELRRLQAPEPTPPPVPESIFDPFASAFAPGFAPNFTDYSLFGTMGPASYGWDSLAGTMQMPQ